MTVSELRQVLANLPDHAEVECEYEGVSDCLTAVEWDGKTVFLWTSPMRAGDLSAFVWLAAWGER